MTNFRLSFQNLTGHPPFPWQEKLYLEFCQGKIPDSLNIPTGLGKTSVIAVWLLAMADNPGRLPRRLVYVVNRRTVVDQTTEEVEKWRRHLQKNSELTLLREKIGHLALSTLRGQFADNREWSADPSRPAVICGTVDMIGSRLLFGGYGGIGFKQRPLHAGFLGQDALILHDEAHLEPAFQRLIEAVVTEQTRCKDLRPLRVMAMTATSRGGEQVAGIGGKDLNDVTVARRVTAAKRLEFHDCKYGLPDAAAAKAQELGGANANVLIFLRKVEDVLRVGDKLRKNATVALLTGTLRGQERDELANSNPVFQRFLSGGPAPEAQNPAFLVCTSAGEVGVNLSADHLVCDLSTFESMAQRFGRVNRFGMHNDSQVHVFHETEFKADAMDQARSKTLDLLKELNGDASPRALSELPINRCREAYAPEPKIPEATDLLFDAWSMTSIREVLPGRRPLEPYLHGIRDDEVPQTRVAWRQEVGEIQTEELRDRFPPQNLMEDFPLKPNEILADATPRIEKQLKALTGRWPDHPAWILDDSGAVEVVRLEDFAGKTTPSLTYKTLLLSPDSGGLNDGTFDGSSGSANDVSESWLDDKGQPRRLRTWGTDSPPPGYRLIRTIILNPENDDDDDGWNWWEKIGRADGEGSQRAQRPVHYSVHIGDVEKTAQAIADGLTDLPLAVRKALLFAARFHDLGKQRRLWQKGIGNFRRDLTLAKSGSARGGISETTAYRHELGSLLDAQRDTDFQKLSDEARDLALHMIAAHHGRARPCFPANEVFDPEVADQKVRAENVACALRFDRLQKRYGRWGLAYCESLLKAADYAASASPSAFVEDAR